MKHWLTGAILVTLLTTGFAGAWWIKGHESVAAAGCAGLPDDVPAFFRAGSAALSHCAGDPDRWKNPAARFLRASEAPDHYIDLEDYQDKELPSDRWKAIALLQELKQKPEGTGMLPYALMENYDRLSCAFYDYRADPKNPAIQAKCLVYAGVLAHLTGDCAMPLHTTRDYDGRKADGRVLQRGIHGRIDGFPEKFGLTAEEMSRGLKAKAIDNVWDYVMKQVHESHSQVERCYELDKAGAFTKPTEESRKFILERCRVGAQFTMDLWYSAWLRSEKMPRHY